MRDTDWGTAIIAACSFLLHFGAAASLYGDWTDPVVDDDSVIAAVIESLQLPAAPEIEHPATNAPVRGEAVSGIESRPHESKEARAGANRARRTQDAERVSDARARAIAGALERLDLEVAGALGSTSSPVDGVLRGEAPMALLDRAAESAAGGERGASLHLGETSGVIKPGAGRAFPVIGNAGPAGPMTVGSASAIRGPMGGRLVDPPAEGGGAVPDAPAVVARLAAGFRRCYQRGLDVDPSMKGSVSLRVRIGPNGEVLSVDPSSFVGLSGDVISCIAAKVSGALFAPPTHGGATLVIPVKLIPQ